MSNPPIPPSPTPTMPAPKGGMPKWLIIVLILLLVVILGCCGGIATCAFLARRAGQAARSGLEAMTQAADSQMRAEQARIDAQQAAARGPGGAPVEAPDAPDSPAGSPAPGGNPGGSAPTFAPTGRMPANFPKDIPVMSGLTATGVSMSDNLKGSGFTTLTGNVKREDAAAYYQKQMDSEGWKLTNSLDSNNTSLLTFSKDTRQSTVEAVQEGAQTTVIITYEQTK